MMHYGSGWFMGGWMWIFWIALIVVIVLVVAAFVRSQGSSGPGPRAASPEDILKERYARGEIDHEEFRRRMDELRR